MDSKTRRNEDIDLSHDDNDNPQNTDEMQSTQGQEFATEEPALSMEKSMRRRYPMCDLSDKDQCHESMVCSGLEGIELKDDSNTVEEKDKIAMPEATVIEEKQMSRVLQIAIFLVMFFGLVLINQAVIYMLLYFFKQNVSTSTTHDEDGQSLEEDPQKYSDQPEFTEEFDKPLEQ